MWFQVLSHELLALGTFYLWLLVMIPLFVTLHQRFISTVGSSHRFINPLGWFVELWRVLGLTSRKRLPFKTHAKLQTLMLFSLIASLIVLASLPLVVKEDPQLSLHLPSSTGAFSLYFVLALLFLIGFVYTAIGFSLKASLLQLTCLEQLTSRQSIVLTIAIACVTATMAGESGSLYVIASAQTQLTNFGVYTLGCLLYPVSFVVSVLALSLYTHQWVENEAVILNDLRQPIEASLTGILFLTFKITRSVEFLALYALITTVFLAGPFPVFFTAPATATPLIFSLKIFCLVILVILTSKVLPQIPTSKQPKLMLLVLIPINILGYFLSNWYFGSLQ